jgi:hypothetical protein
MDAKDIPGGTEPAPETTDRPAETPAINIDDKSPADVLALDAFSRILFYMRDYRNDGKLQLVSADGKVVYDVSLDFEDNSIFFQSGSLTTQLNVRSTKPWHNTLRLTNGSLGKIKEYERKKAEGETIRQETTIVRAGYHSRATRFIAPPSQQDLHDDLIGPKPQKLTENEGIIKTIAELKVALVYDHYRSGEIRYYQEPEKAVTPDVRKSFFILSVGNKYARELTDRLLMDFRQLDREKNEAKRGGAYETIALQLAEAIKCREELANLLMRSSGKARVYIKDYDIENNRYGIPKFTIAVVVVEENPK